MFVSVDSQTQQYLCVETTLGNDNCIRSKPISSVFEENLNSKSGSSTYILEMRTIILWFKSNH